MDKSITVRSNSVPLVVAFTPNYFIPAATCLLSVLKHSALGDTYHVICLLTEDLSPDQKAKLELIGGGRMRFSYIDMAGRLSGIYVDERYTVAASFRLLLPDLLPEYDSVMYVDCDVVVRNNLAELFRNTDLGRNYLAGVFESPLDFQQAHLEAIGCEPGNYINSGFLLMNLALLREDKMVPRFLEAAKSEGLEFPDQDVLNQLCKGRILGLPPYYNSIRTFYLPQYKKFFLEKYTEKDWQDVQRHGTVHYTGSKPWNSFTVEFKVWWHHYEQLPCIVKKDAEVDKKTYLFYKIYKTVVGSKIIDGIKYLYRLRRKINR